MDAAPSITSGMWSGGTISPFVASPVITTGRAHAHASSTLFLIPTPDRIGAIANHDRPSTFVISGTSAAIEHGSPGQETAEAPRITQQEFKKLLAARNVIVVDTRNPEAFPAGHIPGAILLPLEGRLTWPEAYQQSVVEKLKTASKPIVLAEPQPALLASSSA